MNTTKTETTNLWGTFTEDNSVIEFKPKLAVKKIDNPLFSAWVNLCYDMAESDKGSLEIQTIVLLNKQLNEWKYIIPKQEVSGGSVVADLKDCVDLLTGETYLNHRYPMGYRVVGTMHQVWVPLLSN